MKKHRFTIEVELELDTGDKQKPAGIAQQKKLVKAVASVLQGGLDEGDKATATLKSYEFS